MDGAGDTQLLVKIASDVADTKARVVAVEERHKALEHQVGTIASDVRSLRDDQLQAKGAAQQRAGATDVFRWKLGTVMSLVGTSIGLGWFLVGTHIL